MKKFFKDNIASICILLSILMVCAVLFYGGFCVLTRQNIQFADTDKTFKEDYPLLKMVADYMIVLNDDYGIHSIYINNSKGYMNICYGNIYGKEAEIKNEEIKKALRKLFRQGYMWISFDKDNAEDETTITFGRWKKWLGGEYRSGFAYSPDNVGELDIGYIISQKELSTPGWYFYEEDFNEWRANRS